jgi:hypothetical protein
MSKLSRRNFIKYSTLGLGSVVLTACGFKGLPAPTPLSIPTGLPTLTPVPTPASTDAARVQTEKSQNSNGQGGKGKGAKGPNANEQGNGSQSEGNASLSSDSSFIGSEILGRPTDRAVTVNVIPASNSELYFEYGTAPGKYSLQTAAVAVSSAVPVNVLIDNLQPGTPYYYRRRIRLANDSDFSAGNEHSFVTQRTAGSSFVFTIDADPHNQDPNFNGELYNITLTNALKDHPDFHINLGDTFMTEKLKITSLEGVTGTYADIRPHFEFIGADAPLFLVNGNHEGEQGWLLNGGDQNLAVWCTQIRQKYYPNPAPGAFYSGSTTPEPLIGIRDSYYAWNWGDAQFIVLDPFWYTRTKPKQQPNGNWGWTLGKAQYEWLKQTLETSKAKYKFVFIHNLVGGRDKDARGGIESAGFYEWGGNNQDGSWGYNQQRPGWDLPIHQLMVKNRVNAMFHGHDHVFVKQDLDGIVYQECPQPSISHYNNIQLAQDYGYVNGKVFGSSGHLRVTVTTEKVTVEYIRAYLPKDETSSQRNGQVAYTYTIV